jgi:hypothetical protein
MNATTQTTKEPEAITGGDTLNVRDVTARVEWLRNRILNASTLHEERDELVKLESLLSGIAERSGDEQWESRWYPLQLIADDYFEDHAQEIAQDTMPGYSGDVVEWPLSCIDWEKAARELKQDYSMVEFDGETYWYR